MAGKRGNGSNCVTADAADATAFLARAKQRANLARKVASEAEPRSATPGTPSSKGALAACKNMIATPQQKPAPAPSATPMSAISTKSHLAYILLRYVGEARHLHHLDL